MKMKLEGDVIFYENEKMKRMVELHMIQKNQYSYLGEREMEVCQHIRKFMIDNHQELMV